MRRPEKRYQSTRGFQSHSYFAFCWVIEEVIDSMCAFKWVVSSGEVQVSAVPLTQEMDSPSFPGVRTDLKTASNSWFQALGARTVYRKEILEGCLKDNDAEAA